MNQNEYSLAELGWKDSFRDQLSADEQANSLPARVIKTHKGHLVVSTGKNEHLLQIAETGVGSLNEQPTVGDWLLLDGESLVPLRLLTRTSLLQRMSPGQEVKLQPIAANIDTLLIVSSCNTEFNLNRLERYICLAFDAGIEFVMVLTKADLADDPEEFKTKARQLHETMPIMLVDAKDKDSVDCLQKWFSKGESLVLLGSSGVGKTTLLNTINETEKNKTAAIRLADDKGRHTTTTRSLHVMPSGALLIDVPGIRELQLHDCEAGVYSAFSEIAELTEECKFTDCSHTNEPGCAIKKALDEDRIDIRRLKNYLKLLSETQQNKENISEKIKRKSSSGKKKKQAKSKWIG
ncbi:ribosome biogenesis GTPase [Maridesulfovibrio ferrireducens]|uniref:Small ribosomal subunit biogenesis GTPase RsgA n=1 Tax=Maridesulfovibrio ferrireducens TaxID=246191 RepID=A0A1G9LIH7_9BACT|nr:ribosome small subunit-dependent GTPase A [Maridesulfovibrio ferrireducens]SDL61740.1 ribosome biogenesis GTPase [Maridesulfovibrio ferrireducens]